MSRIQSSVSPQTPNPQQWFHIGYLKFAPERNIVPKGNAVPSETDWLPNHPHVRLSAVPAGVLHLGPTGLGNQPSHSTLFLALGGLVREQRPARSPYCYG